MPMERLNIFTVLTRECNKYLADVAVSTAYRQGALKELRDKLVEIGSTPGPTDVDRLIDLISMVENKHPLSKVFKCDQCCNMFPEVVVLTTDKSDVALSQGIRVCGMCLIKALELVGG